jgi:hypothetical protein
MLVSLPIATDCVAMLALRVFGWLPRGIELMMGNGVFVLL